MNCANHPDLPAIAYCRECGKPLCESCRYITGGTVYCQDHAPMTAAAASSSTAQANPAAFAQSAPPPPTPESPYAAPNPSAYASPYTAPPPPRAAATGVSPGLAFMLGLIPGVGAIYNAQYVKGVIHVIIMGLLIAIVNDQDINANLQPLFGMLIAVWVFYMAFEAYHTAKKRQLGEPVDEFSSIVPRHGQPHHFPLAPTVLIAVGLIFLLHNLDILRISQILRYWPVALIGLGVYMLYERVSGSGPGGGMPQGGQR